MLLKSVIRVNMHIKELMMQTHCIADVERDAGMKSTDLISRQAAIDVLDKIFPVDPMRNDYTQGITCGAALAKEYIKQLPSVEPEKGRWTPKEKREKQEIFICSECGGEAHSPWVGSRKSPKPNRCKYRYCPNCGVKMSEIPTDSESEDKE